MKKMIFICFMLAATPAYSITCVKDYGGENNCLTSQDTSGDCAALGYSASVDESCTKSLKCPFDSNYTICIEGAKTTNIDCATVGFTKSDKSSWCAPDKIIKCPSNSVLTLCEDVNPEILDCAEFGFTATDKTSWCQNLVYCPTDSNYTLCKSLNGPGCENKECAIGDVFYADGTCCPVDNFDKNKVPVGVVYALSATDGGIPYDTATAEKTKSKYGRVISLQNLTVDSSTLAFNPENPFGNSSKTLAFGSWSSLLSPFTRYTADTLLTAFQQNSDEIYNGKNNTYNMSLTLPALNSTICTDSSKLGTKDYNKSCTPLAANATLAFYPLGVNKTDTLVGAGNWYLPSVGELSLVSGFDVSQMTSGSGSSGVTNTTIEKINTTLSGLIEKGVAAETFYNKSYLSSNLCISSSISTVCTVDLISWTKSKRYLGYYQSREDQYARASLQFPLKQKNNDGCMLGDVFYSDGTCSNVNDLDTKKKPVGVVYALSATKGGIPYPADQAKFMRANHGRVISLRDLTTDSTTYLFDPENPYDNSHPLFYYFGLQYTPLNNAYKYASQDAIEQGLNKELALYDGKEATLAISKTKSAGKYSPCNGSYSTTSIEYIQSCTPLVANAALAFYPPNVSKTDPIVGAGNWYIPAIGEWSLMRGVGYNSTNDRFTLIDEIRYFIDNSLSVLATKGVDAKPLSSNWGSKNEYGIILDFYWSSTPWSSDSHLWAYYLNDRYSNYGFDAKYRSETNMFVRTSLEF